MSQKLHPPAVPGVPSLEDSYSWLTASLPSRLAETARALPKRLGLGTAGEGGWTDFVGLHPNRELPLYAAQEIEEDTGGLCLSPAELHRFVRAHHVGGFAWLLRDRLADGQVPADEQLMELARRYTEGWRDALAEATGDAGLTETVMADATARWRRGTAAERSDANRGTLSPAAYAGMVRDKLAWVGTPSRALLLSCGGMTRLHAFREAHDLVLLGLQAVDDVIDREEDGARRGTDVPTWLGCSPGALLRVAPKLVARAADRAESAGFSWIGSWLENFAHAIRAWRIDGDAVRDEVAAIGLASELEAAVLAEDGLAVGRAMRAPVGA
jgi:hypothetical protein